MDQSLTFLVKKKIKKLLVANRGEIALRIFRTAREMGITTVAVYSLLDRSSPHVYAADEAYLLTGVTPVQSYLDIDQIITLAKKAKVDAIHPGYGFLSENAEFACAVEASGITFVGPSPESIEQLGSKTNARAIAQRLGIPIPQGSSQAINTINEAETVSATIGYPILLKASAGGGGKGMRIVRTSGEMAGQYQAATNEAQLSFGNGNIFIEKFIQNPKHIEFQFLCDHNGNAVYFPERDCSVQRRHQKLIEESPSTVLSSAVRKEMGEAALSLAREASYTNAGTVEFLFDEAGKYYFLEVNTRLQVEHPVTEMISNVDLVRGQLQIAMGEKLSLAQKDIVPISHAIEFRICAEDHEANFAPSIGTILHASIPQGPGIRFDGILYSGMEVSSYYDSMIAKLIISAPTREEALTRSLRAFAELEIAGVRTTALLYPTVLRNEKFISGKYSTRFLDEALSSEFRINKKVMKILAAALAASK